MTIYKRGDIYYVESKRRGKKTIRMSTGAKTLAAAKRFAASLDLATACPSYALAVDFLRRFYGEEGRIPLGEAWEKYEEVAKAVGRASVAPKTWRLRRERVLRLVEWLGRTHRQVSAVEDVNGVVAAEFAKHLAGMGLKSKTRKCNISDLSTVWTMLAKVSPNLQNPWTGLSPRVDDAERGEPFTDAEADAVIEAAKRVGKGWHLACLVAKYTGLRYGDVATLEWDEVDLEGMTIGTVANKTARFGTSVLAYIHPELLAALKVAKAAADAAPEGTAARQYVLPNHAVVYGDSKRWRAGLDFSEVLKKAGVKDGHTFHSWRHYFRTKLGAAHVSTEVAMRLCGHATEQMSRHYDHDAHAAEAKAAVLSAFPIA